MSTEQQKKDAPAHGPAHGPTASPIAENFGPWLDKFKRGQIVSYRTMAITLVVVTATAGGIWFYYESLKKRSKDWTDLEGASTPAAMEEFIGNHPKDMIGRVARLQLARYQLGPDGIEALSGRDPAKQRAAVGNIEKARDEFEKLAEEFKDDPVIRAECLLARAKAEAVLIGYTKEGSTEFRGTVPKLIEWLDKLAEAAPDTAWGDDAKKLAAALKDPAKKDEFVRVQSGLYVSAAGPSLPGFPGMPGLPPGHPPIGGVPGLPGGGPVPPPVTPPGPTPPGPPAPVAPGPTPPPSTPPGGTPPMPTPPAPPGGTTPMPTPPAMPPGGTPPATPPKTEPPKGPTPPPPTPPAGTPPATPPGGATPTPPAPTPPAPTPPKK